MMASECFAAPDGSLPGPNYDQFKPIIPSSCSGTHHQDIQGVEKVVFLGDSVTVGTPPTPEDDYYRSRLTATLRAKYGDSLEVQSCAQFGAQVEDLLINDEQLKACFPSGVEPKRTLIVMTNGGNDVFEWAKVPLSATDALAKAQEVLTSLRTSIDWLKDPAHFPKGSFVVYANVYELSLIHI